MPARLSQISFEYRVKSANEPHERAVLEGELSDAPWLS
jgi:hypothetical protein